MQSETPRAAYSANEYIKQIERAYRNAFLGKAGIAKGEQIPKQLSTTIDEKVTGIIQLGARVVNMLEQYGKGRRTGQIDSEQLSHLFTDLFCGPVDNPLWGQLGSSLQPIIAITQDAIDHAIALDHEDDLTARHVKVHATLLQNEVWVMLGFMIGGSATRARVGRVIRESILAEYEKKHGDGPGVH